MSTDLEAAGLSTAKLNSGTRDWLITIDFEAFAPSEVALWSKAMLTWAECTRSAGLRFAIFIALEDIARLRSVDPTGYAHFLFAARALHEAGCVFHPHNHQLFDDDAGTRPPAIGGSDRAPGYRKRISLYFNIVHREKMQLRPWLSQLGLCYQRFLDEVGVPAPDRRAFRAGGWDNGSTATELNDYVDSLSALGYTYDSSATSGEYGTSSWRIGAPFGENVFGLKGGVTEVATTFSLDCGVSLLTLECLRGIQVAVANSAPLGVRRKPGVIATVLHFDHLFHTRTRRQLHAFAVRDEATIVHRIRAHFRVLTTLHRLLRVQRTVEFEELILNGESPRPQR
jgi:hypothetical protein